MSFMLPPPRSPDLWRMHLNCSLQPPSMLLTGYSICLTLFILWALNLQHCLQEHTVIGNEQFSHAAHAYHLSLFYFWVCPHAQIRAVGHTEFESRRWHSPPRVKPRSGAPKRICPAGTEAPSGGMSEGDLWKRKEKKRSHWMSQWLVAADTSAASVHAWWSYAVGFCTSLYPSRNNASEGKRQASRCRCLPRP